MQTINFKLVRPGTSGFRLSGANFQVYLKPDLRCLIEIRFRSSLFLTSVDNARSISQRQMLKIILEEGLYKVLMRYAIFSVNTA